MSYCPAGRHIYATVTGFALLYYPFGNGVFHLFVPTILTYLVMLQFQDYSATLSWLVNFTYLIGWCADCPCLLQLSTFYRHMRLAETLLGDSGLLVPVWQACELTGTNVSSKI